MRVSSSLEPLFPCFEHFYARNTYRKDKAEICCNLSIFKPKKSRPTFWKPDVVPQYPFYTFDGHHPNTSWYFEIPFW